MAQLKLLSIIIPVYNGESYISHIVNSICNYNIDIINEIEIILVNDGSVDKSDQLCLELAQNPIVHYYKKENGGIASARNYGLTKAQGRYITFCDQDDFVKAGYQSFLNIIEKDNSDLLLSNYFYGIADNVQKKCIIKQEGSYNRDEILKILAFFIGEGELISKQELQNNSLPIIPVSIWNGIFKKNLIDGHSIKFRRFVDYEDDWLFIISVLFAANKLSITNDAYYCWNKNPKSESHTIKYIPDFFRKRKDLYRWVDDIVEQLPLKTDRIYHYQDKVRLQTIIWGFYNSCNLKIDSFLNEIVQCEDFFSQMHYYNFNIGKFGKLYMYLLKNKFYKLAYYINRYTFNRSYH